MYNIPPVFEKGKYYSKSTKVVAPAFEKGKYYSKSKIMITPPWASATYYERHIDHYYDLVEKGIEKLQEYWNKDVLKTTLGDEYEYDVGDIVGAKDKTTGMEISREITKKIVKIEKGYTEISYEIGE